ncbi:MAG: hypothetical protein J0I47_10910 [Sphingomonas sp.]|uniref:hypothetical protein n=1 Tax=Sphingomonas sp. TaxID=28214 RepID=UPI001AD5216F|nr:hypothetical protein [Sphingomonas sp.]MBN8808721.1 hypothetical protein [Sphingomonas sp.]
MRGIVTMVAGLASIVATPVAAQSFGISRTPAPSRAAPPERPGYEGAYDRADRTWRGERYDCLHGRRTSRHAAQSCDYIQRTPPPLSSDYVKAPAAK